MSSMDNETSMREDGLSDHPKESLFPSSETTLSFSSLVQPESNSDMVEKKSTFYCLVTSRSCDSPVNKEDTPTILALLAN